MWRHVAAFMGWVSSHKAATNAVRLRKHVKCCYDVLVNYETTFTSLSLETMKYGRHILFWFVYCSYFYIQSIVPQSLKEFTIAATYRNAFVSLCAFIPVCVLSVYVSLYFILPFYIETKKYGAAIIAFIILFATGTLINYYGAGIYYHITHVVMYASKGKIALGYLNTVWAMIISGIAIGLKVTRKWFKQQKEIEAINRQKARNELNLQKNKIHPGFLYSSLDSIHADLRESKGASSSMILVLSNLLSYSLYESKTDRVTLQRELNAVNDFISLERMKGVATINLNVDENIEPAVLLVPPMVILSVLQDGFAETIIIKENNENLFIKILMRENPAHLIKVEKKYKQEYELA
jgi:sensor histidine kinase YesM